MKYRSFGEMNLVVMAITNREREMFQLLIQTPENGLFVHLEAAQDTDALWHWRRVVG